MFNIAMNKKILILLSLLSVTSTSFSEGVNKVYWPGFLDVSTCVNGKTCYPELFQNLLNGDLFEVQKTHLTATETHKVWITGYSSSQNEKVTNGTIAMQLKFEDIANNASDGDYGLYLPTGVSKERSNYRLRAFQKGVRANVHLCEIAIEHNTNTGLKFAKCKENTWKQESLTWSQQEIINGAWKSFNINDGKYWGISYMHLFPLANADGKSYGLGLDNLPSGLERTLVFPQLKLRVDSTTYYNWSNKVNRSITTYDYVIKSRMVRLNQRQCYLDSDVDVVKFGKITVSPGDINKINSVDIPTNLSIRCDGAYSEDLYKGGRAGTPNLDQKVPHPISPGNAVHTIQSVTINTPDNMILDNKIGLALGGKKSDMLYVEGSFNKDEDCGVAPLPLKTDISNQVSLKKFQRDDKLDNGAGQGAIANRPLSTIYWKLCKKSEGKVESGKYTGTATINVEYK